ncbi:hypothetical protein PIB30_049062 [Stylosanthes scabra]|uniref:Uncharacterized protein n=1 Tax=Stylosanthes scabra TaxID=79078 RepID=A0ABU6XG11_9FABA|nr:hypothetical protein [Stylosanthes scabra]
MGLTSSSSSLCSSFLSYSSACFITTPPPPFASSPSDELIAPNRASIGPVTRLHAPPRGGCIRHLQLILQKFQTPFDLCPSTPQVDPRHPSVWPLNTLQQPSDRCSSTHQILPRRRSPFLLQELQ